MIAIVDIETGAIARYAESSEGLDMEGMVEVELPDGFDPVQPSHVLVDGQWLPNEDAAWRRLRIERDARLTACDWTQLADVPEIIRDAWQPYRQALRDMTDTADPFAPEWPAQPEQE